MKKEKGKMAVELEASKTDYLNEFKQDNRVPRYSHTDQIVQCL